MEAEVDLILAGAENLKAGCIRECSRYRHESPCGVPGCRSDMIGLRLWVMKGKIRGRDFVDKTIVPAGITP